MDISPDALIAQVTRASNDWPFIWDIEEQHNFPYGLLMAVGSRETNLQDIVGDNGHGHGVFQLDDRSHTIPDPFPVQEQCQYAAAMLEANYARYPSWIQACNVYNSGQPDSGNTTGGDYGNDVMERQAFIENFFRSNYPAEPTTNTTEQPVTDTDPVAPPDNEPETDATGQKISAPIVDAAYCSAGATLVGADGAVYNQGTQFHGSLYGTHLNEPIVAILQYNDDGYCLIAADGGTFPFGNFPAVRAL